MNRKSVLVGRTVALPLAPLLYHPLYRTKCSPRSGHVGAITLTTQFRAQAALGRLSEKANQFPVERWIGNFVHSEMKRKEIMERLRTLGYSGS